LVFLAGTFSLSFDGQTTDQLPHDASAIRVETALNSLCTVQDAIVSRSIHCSEYAWENCMHPEGYTWLVTFSNSGDQHIRPQSPLNARYSHKLSIDDSYLYACRNERRNCHTKEYVISEIGTKQEVQEVLIKSSNFTLSLFGETSEIISPSEAVKDVELMLNEVDGFGRVSVECQDCPRNLLVSGHYVQITFHSFRGDILPLVSSDGSMTVREVLKGVGQRVVGRSPYSAVIDGINSLSSWYVRVYAYNAFGAGLPGLAWPFPFKSTVGPPLVTEGVHLDFIDSRSLQVSWDSPLFDGGGSISSFILEYDTSSVFASANGNPQGRLIVSESAVDTFIGYVQTAFPAHLNAEWRQRLMLSDSSLIINGVIDVGTELRIGGGLYLVVSVNENECGLNCLTIDKDYEGSLVSGMKIYLGFKTKTYSHILEKLIPGIKYYIRVAAENSFGLVGPFAYFGYPANAKSLAPISVPGPVLNAELRSLSKSVLRVDFDSPSDISSEGVNGGAISGYHVGLYESDKSFLAETIEISLSADNFVGGFFEFSYGYKGEFNQFVSIGDEPVYFSILAGSKIVDTNGSDLTSVMTPGDIIKINYEEKVIESITNSSLTLTGYHRSGTGGSTVQGYRMETFIGVGLIIGGHNHITDKSNVQLDMAFEVGDYVKIRNSVGQHEFFLIVAVNQTSLTFNTTYSGTTILTSIYSRKRTMIPFDATAHVLEKSLNSLPDIGSVVVSSTGRSASHGSTWVVTFHSNVNTQCPQYCPMVHTSNRRTLDVTHSGVYTDGQFILKEYSDGRPFYFLPETSSTMSYDEDKHKWKIESYAGVVWGIETNSTSPLINWTNNVTVTGGSRAHISLTGNNADIQITTIREGSQLNFDNISHSKFISGSLAEVQKIEISWTGSKPYGFFYISFENHNIRARVNWNESASDFSLKLRSLPNIGTIDVSKVMKETSIAWLVTFLSNNGDLELLNYQGVDNIDGTVTVDIQEVTKGLSNDLFAEFNVSRLDIPYIAHIAAINNAGIGPYTDTIQKEGNGIKPISRTPASTPGKVDLSLSSLSESQIEGTFVEPDSHGLPIILYKVEWFTGLLENGGQIKISIASGTHDDILHGKFKIIASLPDLDVSETTIPISFEAEDQDLELAISNLSLVGECSVQTITRSDGNMKWLVTLLDDVVGVKRINFDIQQVETFGLMTTDIELLSFGEIPENYGFDYIYSNSDGCGSIISSENSGTQYLHLLADFNGSVLSDGSYRLKLGREETNCIPFNASTTELENELLLMSIVEDVDVASFGLDSSNLFPFGYKIIFNDLPSPNDQWPQLVVPPESFGRELCEPFIGGLDHRAVVFSMEEKTSCSHGIHYLEAIVLESETRLGGTFDIHYGASVKKDVSVYADSVVMLSIISSLMSNVIEVSKRTCEEKTFCVAWIIKYNIPLDSYDHFIINDSRITGKNSAVHIYPLFNLTLTSQKNDMSGDFRIYLGNEVTGPISHKATQKKVLSELEKIDGMGKAFSLGSQYENDESALQLKVLVDNSLEYSGQRVLISTGDISSSVAIGDIVQVGSCLDLIVESLVYERYNTSFGGGLIFDTKYNTSLTTKSAKLNGFTVIGFQAPLGTNKITNFTNSCSQIETDVGEAKFGTIINAKKMLPGLVKIERGWSIINVTFGDTFIWVSEDISVLSTPSLVTIENYEYIAEATLVNGLPCIKIDKSFPGPSITNSNRVAYVFINNQIVATTTSDLSSILFPSAILYIETESFQVVMVQGTSLQLRGKVKTAMIDSHLPILVEQYGSEYMLVMKRVLADLATFRISPDPNWRGTGSNLMVSKCRGSESLKFVIGNLPEVQVLVFRDESPTDDGTTFSLIYNEDISLPINWPTGTGLQAKLDIATELKRLPSQKGNLKVSTSIRSTMEYVYSITFSGKFSKGMIPDIDFVINQSDDSAKISFSVAQEGAAGSGLHKSSHYSLKFSDDISNDMEYNVRITAMNEEGYGEPSNQKSVQLLSKLPESPISVKIGVQYDSTSLSLQFNEPRNNGGSEIAKYLIEWDSSSSFVVGSTSYGSSEISYIYEVQEIVLSCKSDCYGSFAISWGGLVSNSLSVHSSTTDIEYEVGKLLDGYNNKDRIIHVSKKSHGFGYRWIVTFTGVNGNIGPLRVDDDFLEGGDPLLYVKESRAGMADLIPGSYTSEIQTITIRKKPGYMVPISGSFVLSFEDEETDIIDVNSSAEMMKQSLETLNVIHTVNVQKRADQNHISWIVTFKYLTKGHREGSGDLSLIQVTSTSFGDPTVTTVDIFENIKGSQLVFYTIVGFI
jgi:hypothetical protein